MLVRRPPLIPRRHSCGQGAAHLVAIGNTRYRSEAVEEDRQTTVDCGWSNTRPISDLVAGFECENNRPILGIALTTFRLRERIGQRCADRCEHVLESLPVVRAGPARWRLGTTLND